MGFQYYILFAFVLFVGYLAISRYLRFKKTKKESIDKVWELIPYEFKYGSRESLIFSTLYYEFTIRGMKPLKADAIIVLKAYERAWEMDSSGIIDHSESHDELIELKINGSDGSADLIGYAYAFPESTVGDDNPPGDRDPYGWLGSPKHREAILNPRYDYCGICSLKRANGKWIDVLMLVDEKTVGI